MTKLTLLALLTATTLKTASAEGMFSMGDMMKEMTDVAKGNQNRNGRCCNRYKKYSN